MERDPRNPDARPDIEDERIDWIRERVGADHIGDDAAVWTPSAGQELVLSVDAQAEGTHFRRSWMSPREIGARAVHAAISDLAAMAARPRAILVALLLPGDFDDADFQELAEGLVEASEHCGAPIVGGNTSRGALSLTITAVGEVEAGRALRRDRLQVGDEVWVTGVPGLASRGLRLLRDRVVVSEASADARKAIDAFRCPRARVDEARAIAERLEARAAIDLSDGLARDLGHLIEETRRAGRDVGVELDRERLSSLEPVASLAKELAFDPVAAMLLGGEDYELCFTVTASEQNVDIAREISDRFEIALTRVGTVISEPGVWIRSDGEERSPWRGSGFAHF